jgi:23S rRNA (guanosine2251-2'-O)-methyltransferase
VSSFRERNDRKSRPEQGWSPRPDGGADAGGDAGRTRDSGKGGGKDFGKGRRHAGRKDDVEGWLWGRHAVEAALANPARTGPLRLIATESAAREIAPLLKARGEDVRVETGEIADIARNLPPSAVHQGLALRSPPLEDVTLEDLAESGSGVIIMLDQVTDPQNVGAVFRSAAAFGAKGIILQDRNSPRLDGALAKAAAGAVDRLPCARVVNLSRALEKLTDLGWRAVGLDGAGEETLEATLDGRPTVLVFGSEGEGLRRLVAEHCDAIANIPMPGGFESLNVSNAAAIALYEATRKTR